MQTALIIEDHAEARAWMCQAIAEAFTGMQVHQAGDLAGARAALEHITPDITLIDLGLPDGGGASLIPGIKKRCPQGWVIVVTVFDDDRHLFDALRSGADGYLVKDQCRDGLARQIEKIMQGQPPLSPSVARRMLEFFRTDSRQDASSTLTPREVDVLCLIAKGYSTSSTASMLGISSHTVAGYVKDVYRKLNVGSRAEAALEAVRRGFIKD